MKEVIRTVEMHRETKATEKSSKQFHACSGLPKRGRRS
jgi:hypothetical protein